MRRLIPLLAAVLALALSSTAAADTFRVVHPHGSSGGNSSTTAFAPSAAAVPFTQQQDGPMSFAALRSIWQAAGNTYGIPWEVLAAINKVETNFGQNLGPSSAGAVGWMQFMPSTWARWGMDANGDGIADPNNPTDAIFSAARYLAGCGGQFDIARAVYCYNHATWYVNEVLGLAAQYGRGLGTGLDTGTSLFAVDQLQSQLKSARKQVAASNTQLASARARARVLAHAQRRFLQLATHAPLLSDQLEARRHAVLLGVRREAAEARANRLSERLDSVRAQLGSLRAQATGGFALSSPTLLSLPTFSAGSYTGADGSVVPIALQYLGVPYVWAGASPSGGFDCSGLVQYVFGQLGVSLPHNTVAQWNDPAAVSVPRDALEPGDLVFFNKLDHVGIYIGNGYFIDAPHTGTTVRIDSLGEGWYAANYDGAKRIVSGSLGSSADSVGAMSFTTNGGGGPSFTSNVVYFTH
jgi:cell wall-associated NlpC family hydrolase